MQLKDRVAVVTGAASGIGAATARRLSEAGASAVLADINDGAGESVTEQIHAAGGNALFVHTDVAHEVEVSSVMAAAVEAFGRLDVLHNNAADLSAALFARDRTIDIDGGSLAHAPTLATVRSFKEKHAD